MDWVGWVQLVAIVAFAAAVIMLVYLAWRRRRLGSGRGAFECYYRKAGAKEAAHWHHGIVRYRRDAVVWFPLLAFGFKPRWSVPRLRVRIGHPRPPTDREQLTLMTGQTIVPITPDGSDVTLEWAMAPNAADGLVAWAEAAPPGEGQYGHTRRPGGGGGRKQRKK
jgi:hypothetical protein